MLQTWGHWPGVELSLSKMIIVPNVLITAVGKLVPNLFPFNSENRDMGPLP